MKKYLLFLLAFNFQVAFATEHSVIAVVDDAPITDLDLDRRLTLITKSNNIKADSGTIAALKPRILEMLIDEKLFDQDAKKLNITVDDADVEYAIKSIAENNKVTLQNFYASLSKAGVSKDELKNQIRHQLLWSKLIKTQIEPFLKVTDQDTKDSQFHRSNLSTRYPGKVRLAEIVIFQDARRGRSEALSAKLLEKLKSGTQFESLAKDFSQSSSAENGGEIGWFYIDQLSDEFIEAVADMNPGDISGPIIVDDTIYIIKVLERDSGALREDLKQGPKDEEIKAFLKQQKMNARIKEYLFRLRNQAFIDIK